MATPLESRRIVIAGASSLLGVELKSLLEESRFAASDFRLVDEETVAGILTEAGGEPAVIQPVEEDSFNKAWLVFFAGSPAFSKRNIELARRSGARIVDLSGEFVGQAEAQIWLPKFDGLASSAFRLDASVFAIPSAPAEIIARLRVALRSLKLSALTAVAFQPVSSSAGKAGIEELEAQSGQLLSFQSLGKQVFDAQVAFTMLDRFGVASNQSLQSSLGILRREVRSCLRNETPSRHCNYCTLLSITERQSLRARCSIGRPIRPKSQKHARRPASASLPMTRLPATSARQEKRHSSFPLRKPIPPPQARGGSGRRQTICVCRRQTR